MKKITASVFIYLEKWNTTIDRDVDAIICTSYYTITTSDSAKLTDHIWNGLRLEPRAAAARTKSLYM